MALGDSYATLDEFKDYLKIPLTKTSYDEALTDALASVSREINKHCNRQFNTDGTATARVYKPDNWRRVLVDDFHTTTGMVLQTDPGGIGVFSDTWTYPLEFELYPLNGIVDGEPGWPYSRLRASGGRYFPKYDKAPYRHEAVVQLTANWGWAAVPSPIKQACLIMAASTFEIKNAPFGVAGMTQFGSPVRVRDNPMAERKLCPFVRSPFLVG